MPASMKTGVGDGDEYTFEAVVSVFNNKDLGGDIVRPGAFAKSLQVWEESGDPIPIYWSHRLDDPTMNIGVVEKAQEVGPDGELPDWVNPHVKTHGGLYVKGRLDDYGVGKHVHQLMKQRRVKQFSFTYDVIREHQAKAGDANELLELWLHEVGPTPLGMNPLTELIGAKNAPPPEPDDPSAEKSNRRPSAVFLRLQTDLLRWRTSIAD
jgi:phage head maturation protease